MRIVLGILIFLLGAAGLGGMYLKGYPYRQYSKWMRGQGYDRYFELSAFKELYLKSPALADIPPYQEDYVQLWKEFPLRNSLIPMPTRHPMFQSVPVIEMTGKNATPQLGIILLDPSGREVSRVYTLPNRFYQDHSQGQELFKLPYFRNRIRSKNLDELWKDIFSYNIEVKDKPIDEMIYDLYLLHLRSKLLPKETIRYGLIKDGKQVLIELDSKDKDYMVELVLTQKSGSIFSYILKTEKRKNESMKLRSKLLESISFSPVDEAIGKVLYTEFKALNYARQVDQEGMLYLFSAWSQTPENVDLIKEMIFYLERGKNTKSQLKNIYTYAFKRYGKTFTSRIDVDDQDDPELVLQRKIEIENRDSKKAAEEAQIRPQIAPELRPDEKMNMYLKKAKEAKASSKDSGEMLVH